jgi:hypothetical protein
LCPALFCLIHHVVVHQRGDVDKLNDHGEIDVSRIDGASGAAGKQSQQWPKPFAPTAHRIGDVAFDCWIEGRGLFRNARFDLLKVRLN